jgi:hypothetical protein
MSSSININDNQVISSGVIIFSKGDAIKIKPFGDYTDFEIDFRTEFVISEKTTSSTSYEPSDKGIIITLKKNWVDGNRTALSSPSLFGSREDKSYYFRYSFETIGSQEKYSAILNFSIVEEKANG